MDLSGVTVHTLLSVCSRATQQALEGGATSNPRLRADGVGTAAGSARGDVPLLDGVWWGGEGEGIGDAPPPKARVAAAELGKARASSAVGGTAARRVMGRGRESRGEGRDAHCDE